MRSKASCRPRQLSMPQAIMKSKPSGWSGFDRWVEGTAAMALRTSAVILLALLPVVGCDRPTTRAASRPHTLWLSSGGNESGPFPAYQNFYETYDKYPGYALATYEIDEAYDSAKDLKHLADAVHLCRRDFGAAFRSGTLTRWQSNSAVPFKPEFVVVALHNRKDHSGESTFDASYRVAWLIPASRLFDDGISAQDLVANVTPDRRPFAHDPLPEGSYYPVELCHWRIIERHMAVTTQPAGAGG